MNERKLSEQELIDGVTKLILQHPSMSLDRYREVRVLYGLSDHDAIDAQQRYGFKKWKSYISALESGYTHSQITRAIKLGFSFEWLDQDTQPLINEMMEFCEHAKQKLTVEEYWSVKNMYYTLCVYRKFSHSEFMSAYDKGIEFLQNLTAIVAYMGSKSERAGLTYGKLIQLMDGKTEEQLYYLQQNVPANTSEQQAYLKQELANVS